MSAAILSGSQFLPDVPHILSILFIILLYLHLLHTCQMLFISITNKDLFTMVGDSSLFIVLL